MAKGKHPSTGKRLLRRWWPGVELIQLWAVKLGQEAPPQAVLPKRYGRDLVKVSKEQLLRCYGFVTTYEGAERGKWARKAARAQQPEEEPAFWDG